MGNRRDLWETEFVQEHIENAIRAGAEQWSSVMFYGLRCELNGSNFESPLEAAFYVWWSVLAEVRGYSDWVILDRQADIQLNEAMFRADFVVRPKDEAYLQTRCQELHLPMVRHAVELDGHEFHEKTKDQVAYRNRRDRLLQEAGWQVHHYSGSEFHRRPLESVNEAYSSAFGSFWQLRHRISAIDTERRTSEQVEADNQHLDELFGTKTG